MITADEYDPRAILEPYSSPANSRAASQSPVWPRGGGCEIDSTGSIGVSDEERDIDTDEDDLEKLQQALR
jgi:hypothetical protein